MARRRIHEKHMRRALELAASAAELGEAPIGAVVVDDSGAVIGEGFNRRIADDDPTGHAEILALRLAARAIGDWRLTGCTLYVTLEPCPMCAGALVNARVTRLVYGCDDPKAGAVRSLYSLCEDPRLNHRIEVVRGVLSEQAGDLLKVFFAQLRSEDRRSSENR